MHGGRGSTPLGNASGLLGRSNGLPKIPARRRARVVTKPPPFFPDMAQAFDGGCAATPPSACFACTRHCTYSRGVSPDVCPRPSTLPACRLSAEELVVTADPRGASE